MSEVFAAWGAVLGPFGLPERRSAGRPPAGVLHSGAGPLCSHSSKPTRERAAGTWTGPTEALYNAANQMRAAGAITYSYDANGNLSWSGVRCQR